MITDLDNWQIIKKYGIYATNSKKIFDELTVGDKVIMYLIPKQISGLFIVEDLSPVLDIKFRNKEYKYYFKLSAQKIMDPPLKISKLERIDIINKISIFKNKSHWGGVIMGKSIISITEKDYLLFENRLNRY